MIRYYCDGDLKITENNLGLEISQNGRVYVAKNWRLTSDVLNVVKAGRASGLRCHWQEGHPSGHHSHHISFSFSHERNSWVFVLGAEARPPGIVCVTFNKRFKEVFRQSEFGLSWESAGGNNILVPYADFSSVINALDFSQTNLFPRQANQSNMHRSIGFQSETELESALLSSLSSRFDRFDRQISFPSEDRFKFRDRLDFVLINDQSAILCEIKLHEGDEAALAQVKRYASNKVIQSRYAPRKVSGILIADRFSDEVRQNAPAEPEISLYTYHETPTVTLSHVSGPRLL